MLRFDVETIYKATGGLLLLRPLLLRFDVETIYKATETDRARLVFLLRFDVETIYKATLFLDVIYRSSCGLM